jgi:hypothetical protein
MTARATSADGCTRAAPPVHGIELADTPQDGTQIATNLHALLQRGNVPGPYVSTNSAHRVIDGATHEALIAEKEYAAATTQAILDVVSVVQSAEPLIK